jgi:asparagine N-glycosylation enzyme membrane subunit Stt3
MKELFTSASKIVFILLAVTSCTGFFLGKLDPKDFMILAGMAFSFYFANKGDATQPYAGK